MNPQAPKRIAIKQTSVVVVVAIIIGIIFLLVTQRLAKLAVPVSEVIAATHKMNEMDATLVTFTNDLRMHGEQSEGELALVFLHGKQEKRVLNYAEMDKHDAAITQAIAQITPLLTSPSEKEALSKLVTSRSTYRDNLFQTMDALELGNRAKAETLFSTLLLENLHELQGLVAKLVIVQQDAMSARHKEMLERKDNAEVTFSRSRVISIGLGLGAALVVLLPGLLLTRRMATP